MIDRVTEYAVGAVIAAFAIGFLGAIALGIAAEHVRGWWHRGRV